MTPNTSIFKETKDNILIYILFIIIFFMDSLISGNSNKSNRLKPTYARHFREDQPVRGQITRLQRPPSLT